MSRPTHVYFTPESAPNFELDVRLTAYKPYEVLNWEGEHEFNLVADDAGNQLFCLWRMGCAHLYGGQWLDADDLPKTPYPKTRKRKMNLT